MDHAVSRNDLGVVDDCGLLDGIITRFLGVAGEIPSLLELGRLAAARLEREVGAVVAQRAHRRRELDATECPEGTGLPAFVDEFDAAIGEDVGDPIRFCRCRLRRLRPLRLLHNFLLDNILGDS